MRFKIFLLLFGITSVLCKNHVKSLTEQMGQEVIEMGAPIKELPPGLDEEPSAEFDDDEKTSASAQPATKRETKKMITTTSTVAVGRTKKTGNKTNEAVSQEDEDRIEKELAEIYKDTDYKSETTTDVPAVTTKQNAKKLPLIGRAKTSFKFQPNVENREDVERFRTSIDDITCDKQVTQRLHDVVVLQPDEGLKKRYHNERGGNDADQSVTSSIIMNIAFLFILVCH